MRTSHQHKLWHSATDWIALTKAYIHASWKINTAAMSLTLPWIFYVSCIFLYTFVSLLCWSVIDWLGLLMFIRRLLVFLSSHSALNIPENCFKNQHDIQHKFSTFPAFIWSSLKMSIEVSIHTLNSYEQLMGRKK